LITPIGKSLLFSLTIFSLSLLLCKQNVDISYFFAFAAAQHDIQPLTKKGFFFFDHEVVLVTIINCYQIFLLLVIGQYSVMEEGPSGYILVLKKGQSVTGPVSIRGHSSLFRCWWKK